jgi:hypothetical protein
VRWCRGSCSHVTVLVPHTRHGSCSQVRRGRRHVGVVRGRLVHLLRRRQVTFISCFSLSFVKKRALCHHRQPPPVTCSSTRTVGHPVFTTCDFSCSCSFSYSYSYCYYCF